MPKTNLVRRSPKAAVTPPPATPAVGAVDGQEDDTRSFLPDFRSRDIAIRFAFVAVIITIVIVLSRNAMPGDTAWQELAVVSLFAGSIAAGSVIALRLLSAPIQRMTLIAGTMTAFIIMILVSVVASELIIWLMFKFDRLPTRWPADHAVLLLRIVIITAVVALFVLRYSIINRRVEVETKSQQDDRLQALQSRIRPHFMFNSLNSVAGLIRSEPEMAEKALEDLADVFRVLLADARKMVPITVEGELSRQYLEIEKLRLGERLSVRWIASNVPRSALIPSLTIQPLVENAVYHGIEPSGQGGMITVNLWSEGETLKIHIRNPLPERQNRNHRKGNNMALDNVRERLERHFGGRAVLENVMRDGFYDVHIQIPVVRG